MNKNPYNVIVIGAGASGMFCALESAKRGMKVLLIDHQKQAGRKIRISGGGRCNFTNLDLTADNYISQNPHFCLSALKRFTPYDCLEFFTSLGFEYTEKNPGQLFCASTAEKVANKLVAECKKYGVEIALDCHIKKLFKKELFYLQTNIGELQATSLVIATGGLSYQALGASNFSYKIAEQFGLEVIAPCPALVPLKFNKTNTEFFKLIAGVALKVSVATDKISFCDDLLFTHVGLSGPAILQISSYLQDNANISINLLPDIDLFEHLKQSRSNRPKAMLQTILIELLPKRLAQLICTTWLQNRTLAEHSNDNLQDIVAQIQNWQLQPTGNLGYKIAEVTAGGVDTNEISSKTFETKKVKGLYFIGEALDVIGQLGGYNLHWAWASGYCCGQQI